MKPPVHPESEPAEIVLERPSNDSEGPSEDNEGPSKDNEGMYTMTGRGLGSLLLRTGLDPNEVLIGEGTQDCPSILAELEDPVAGLLVGLTLAFLEEERFRSDMNPSPTADATATTVMKDPLVFCQGSPIPQAPEGRNPPVIQPENCLLYTSDAADE